MDFRLAALRRAYAEGATPASVVDEVFRRIEDADDPGIFITLRAKSDVIADANALGAFDGDAKPLFGIPFAVKDNIDVAGLPTTASCPDFAYTPTATATAVQRLLDAGALLVGKTNLDQFASGLVGLRTPYPIPRNAIREDLIPGGSSSGSAIAVARAMVSFALGTDTAGSGRVPAALNNIVGMKPSLGLVSTTGVLPACRTLDCVSVFALTVDDAWAVTSAMAAFDPADPFSRAGSLALPALPPSLRVGVPRADTLEFFGDEEARAAFAAALRIVERLGFSPQEIDFSPFREVADLLYAGPWVAERYQAIRSFIETSPESLHPVTRDIIGGARRFSAADAFAGIYRLAGLRRATQAAWQGIDVLAVPSVPAVYTKAQVEADPIALNAKLGIYTNFVNLLDLCALAVPSGMRMDGAPAGITLIAPRERDGLIAALGNAVHGAAKLPLGATALVPDDASKKIGAPPGWIEVAVLGAHMAGLPLNAELQALNAVFVRKAETAPDYKLFLLGGGAVPRPGLLRVADGQGAPIACEVWALSAEAFGRFAAAIQPPLSLGTLRLADGSAPKGFLAEAEGVAGCRDISRFGSWRAYLASP